jgi:excisionase family DNA binding protein
MTAPAPETLDRQFYTVKEFCRRNSIGKTFFYELVKGGTIAVVKCGRKTLVPALSEVAFSAKISTHKSTHNLNPDLGEPRRT